MWWYFVFAAQPWIAFLGIAGVLGKEAEEAAGNFLEIAGKILIGIVAVVVFVVVAVYLYSALLKMGVFWHP